MSSVSPDLSIQKETLATIQQATQPGDWLISIDLKVSYFHVPVQRFLHMPSVPSRPRTSAVYLPPLLADNLSPSILESPSGFGGPQPNKGIHLYHFLGDLLVLSLVKKKKQLLVHREQVI